MATLIDASLWIDFTRSRSPRVLKEFIAPYILDPASHLAEPVAFEVLRYATPPEARILDRQFRTFPVLPTPPDLWTVATHLGQDCRRHGVTVGSLDLLIAAIAMAAGATLVTFDEDFQHIARAGRLSVALLHRPQEK